MANFVKYFENFKKYAFRLELLQKYDVEEEKEQVKEFLKTGKFHKIRVDERWEKIIKNALKRGAVMQRIHVMELPLTDYMKFELITNDNIKAGEEIFFILKEDYDEMKYKLNGDFWLFDDEIVLKMNYDSNGGFLGFDEIKQDLFKYIKFKDKLLSIAKPIDELKTWQR